MEKKKFKEYEIATIEVILNFINANGGGMISCRINNQKIINYE